MKKLLLSLVMLFALSAFAQNPLLPIDFDDPADDAWVGQGGVVYTLETSLFSPDVVGKIEDPGTVQWDSRVNLALGTHIDMTTANKTFTFEYYTTTTDVMTGLFQIGLEKNGGYAIEMQFTTDGLIGWQTVTLDFIGATNAYPNQGEPVVYGEYAQISIFTNFGSTGIVGTYYFDDIAGPPNGSVVGADPGPTTQPMPQPSAAPEDVISIYSDVYTDLANYWHPGWGQTTVVSDETIPGITPTDNIKKLKYLNYEAVVLDGGANPTNVGAMEYVHIDIWSIDDTPIRMYLLTGPEPYVELATVASDWVSYNIPIGDFTGANLAAFWGIKWESGNWAPGSSPLVYFDNIYFWKTPGPTFDPANGALNVPADVNPTITFPLPVEMAGGSTITNGDIPSIVTFKETDAAGPDVPFTGSINPAEDVLTIIPDANLNLYQAYYLALNHEVIQYQGGSLIEGEDVTFTTESGPFDLPVTFEETTVNYGVGNWGGNSSSIIVDPTDPTNMVMETVDADYEWSGSFLGGPNGTGLDNPIPFVTGSTSMSMRVWSPEAGVPIIFKVENGTNAGIAAEVTVNTTMASAWETMIFDLSAQLNLAEEYHKIVLLFNAGINEPGDTYYWDDVEFVSSAPDFTFDPVDGATNVAITVNPTLSFTVPVELPDGSPITNGDVPSLIVLKETDAFGPDVPFTGTIDGAKQVMTVIPSSPFSYGQTYFLALKNQVIRYQGGSLIGSENITFSTLGPLSGGFIYTDFDGNENVTFTGWPNVPVSVANPNPGGINTSANAGEWQRGFETYAHISTELPGYIDFSGYDLYTMNIYSPIECLVKFKIEDKTDPGIFTEVDAMVTTPNQWEQLVFDFTGTASGTYNKIVIFIDFESGGDDIFYFDDLYGPAFEGGFEVELKAFLEGPYTPSGMNSGLNPTLIPLNQPYNVAPWNYSGSESVGAITDPKIVDWVLVECRDAATAADATSGTMIAQQAALIHSTGDIVAVDDATTLTFDQSITDNLFIVIWHRNHVNVLSATGLVETGGVYTYDFSTAQGQAYLGNQTEVSAGVWGLYGGDANADGTIDDLDKDVWDLEAATGGYLQGDLNMDGQVDNVDKNDVWLQNSVTALGDWQLIWEDDFNTDGSPAPDK